MTASVCSVCSVTSSNRLWALDREGRVYRRDVCILARHQSSPQTGGTTAVENDWEIV